jgi:hypothetical protein
MATAIALPVNIELIAAPPNRVERPFRNMRLDFFGVAVTEIGPIAEV